MSKELSREAFSSFVRALAFASRKQSQQRRNDADASPYINHPIALVSILAGRVRRELKEREFEAFDELSHECEIKSIDRVA